MFVISLCRSVEYLHVPTYLVPPLRPSDVAPRSPCGENRVLRYSTVRYMYLLDETLHYVSSFLLRYLPTGTYLCTYRSCLLPPSRYRGTYRSTTLPSLPPETRLFSIVLPTTSISLPLSRTQYNQHLTTYLR